MLRQERVSLEILGALKKIVAATRKSRNNGSNFFKISNSNQTQNTVFDDAAVDRVWGDSGNDWFFANTVELIEGPTFSQAYTPLSAGFFQQGSQYFERLSAMYDYIKANVVNVVVRDISALQFRDGTTQTTAATGGGGSGTVVIGNRG